MLATRTTAPDRSPAPREERRDRNHLRVVVEQSLPGRSAAVVVASIFTVLLATAALNTVLVANQRDLDQVEARIREGEQRNQSLRLRVAELEVPARIKAAAAADGMIEPDEVTWLTPEPDGGSHAVVERRTGADEPITSTGEDETDRSTSTDEDTGDTEDADTDHADDGDTADSDDAAGPDDLRADGTGAGTDG